MNILVEILAILAGIIGATIPVAIVVGIPLLIIYAIYRAIKGIMTHNAELKRRYENNGNQNPENRWTDEQ